ncbi:MAG: hypothetical protein HZB43_13130 [candidate division Zixibacteria bacterium]|nr:hypothetical protein [candidate division Zixibacteria bacterium]
MKTRWWFAAALVLVAAALVAAGCSKKDSGTNARVLTPEEQFATFEQYTGGIDSLGINSIPLLTSSAGMKFWDGVQPWDALSLLDILSLVNFGLTSPKLDGVIPAPLGKRSVDQRMDLNRVLPLILRSAAVQEGEYAYDPASGYWKASLELTGAIDTSITSEGETVDIAATFNVNMRDSVRFDNSQSGVPSEQPSEATDRSRHGSKTSVDVALSLVIDSLGVTVTNVNIRELQLNGGGLNTVTGINLPQVTVNGNSTFEVAVDMSATVPDSIPGHMTNVSAEGSTGMTTAAHAVEMDNSDEPCPTSGTVTAGMTMDLETRQNGENRSAEGSWDMTINFTGGGNASVSVQSGAFTKTASGSVCTPPL